MSKYILPVLILSAALPAPAERKLEPTQDRRFQRIDFLKENPNLRDGTPVTQADIPWSEDSEGAALQYALKCRRKFRGFNKDLVLVMNYQRQGEYPRMMLLNIKNPKQPKIILPSHVGHGTGNIQGEGQGFNGMARPATVMRDTANTASVSPGCMVAKGAGGRVISERVDRGITEESPRWYSEEYLRGTKPGDPIYPGFHMYGLEYRNQCVFPRGQKLHKSPNLIRGIGVTGSSAGCTNIHPEDYEFLKNYTRQGLLVLNFPGQIPMEQELFSPQEGERKGLPKVDCIRGSGDQRPDVKIDVRKKPYPYDWRPSFRRPPAQ